MVCTPNLPYLGTFGFDRSPFRLLLSRAASCTSWNFAFFLNAIFESFVKSHSCFCIIIILHFARANVRPSNLSSFCAHVGMPRYVSPGDVRQVLRVQILRCRHDARRRTAKELLRGAKQRGKGPPERQIESQWLMICSYCLMSQHYLY